MSPIGVFDHVWSCDWAALREKLEMQHMVIDATLADMGVDPPTLCHNPPLCHPPRLCHTLRVFPFLVRAFLLARSACRFLVQQILLSLPAPLPLSFFRPLPLGALVAQGAQGVWRAL
jgi:hypothetical protein